MFIFDCCVDCLLCEAFSNIDRSLAHRNHVVNLPWLTYAIPNFELLNFWKFEGGLLSLCKISLPEYFWYFWFKSRLSVTFGRTAVNALLPVHFESTSGLSRIAIAKRFMVWRNLNVRSQINQNPRIAFWLADIFISCINHVRYFNSHVIIFWQIDNLKQQRFVFKLLKLSNYIISKKKSISQLLIGQLTSYQWHLIGWWIDQWKVTWSIFL